MMEIPGICRSSASSTFKLIVTSACDYYYVPYDHVTSFGRCIIDKGCVLRIADYKMVHLFVSNTTVPDHSSPPSPFSESQKSYRIRFKHLQLEHTNGAIPASSDERLTTYRILN